MPLDLGELAPVTSSMTTNGTSAAVSSSQTRVPTRP